MADPITIVGAVAAVAQLVEYAGKLIYGTREIYKITTKGVDPDYTITTITTSLQNLSNKLSKLRPTPDRRKGADPSHDREIEVLCNRAVGLADNLLQALNGLKGVEGGVDNKQQYWKNFQHALQSKWGVSKVNKYAEQLDGLRQQISMHILVSIW
jgi:hypothetical protein